jgi:hypothetical protein
MKIWILKIKVSKTKEKAGCVTWGFRRFLDIIVPMCKPLNAR